MGVEITPGDAPSLCINYDKICSQWKTTLYSLASKISGFSPQDSIFRNIFFIMYNMKVPLHMIYILYKYWYSSQQTKKVHTINLSTIFETHYFGPSIVLCWRPPAGKKHFINLRHPLGAPQGPSIYKLAEWTPRPPLPIGRFTIFFM